MSLACRHRCATSTHFLSVQTSCQGLWLSLDSRWDTAIHIPQWILPLIPLEGSLLDVGRSGANDDKYLHCQGWIPTFEGLSLPKERGCKKKQAIMNMRDNICDIQYLCLIIHKSFCLVPKQSGRWNIHLLPDLPKYLQCCCVRHVGLYSGTKMLGQWGKNPHSYEVKG